jgi:hypothetical protein
MFNKIEMQIHFLKFLYSGANRVALGDATMAFSGIWPGSICSKMIDRPPSVKHLAPYKPAPTGIINRGLPKESVVTRNSQNDI